MSESCKYGYHEYDNTGKYGFHEYDNTGKCKHCGEKK